MLLSSKDFFSFVSQSALTSMECITNEKTGFRLSFNFAQGPRSTSV